MADQALRREPFTKLEATKAVDAFYGKTQQTPRGNGFRATASSFNLQISNRRRLRLEVRIPRHQLAQSQEYCSLQKLFRIIEHHILKGFYLTFFLVLFTFCKNFH